MFSTSSALGGLSVPLMPGRRMVEMLCALAELSVLLAVLSRSSPDLREKSFVRIFSHPLCKRWGTGVNEGLSLGLNNRLRHFLEAGFSNVITLHDFLR